MGIHTERIEAAAELLDSLVGKFDWLTPAWRQIIDLDKLNMTSITCCVLGQLNGDWDRAVEDIKGEIGYYGWVGHESMFSGYTEAWKEYLRSFVTDPWPVGSTLWGKTDKREYKVMSYFEDNDIKRITLKDVKNGSFYSDTVDYVRKAWQLEDPNKPKYEKGDLLKGDKGSILIVGDLLDGVLQAVRVTSSGGYADLDYYLRGGGYGEKFTLVHNISTYLEMAGLIK